MPMDYSAALIVPANRKADADYLACALGHDVMPGNTYNVPLSADGQEPATHYGTHTWAGVEFVQLLQGAAQGQLPPIPWGDYQLTEAAVFEVIAALKSSVQPREQYAENWSGLLAAEGLQVIQTGET